MSNLQKFNQIIAGEKTQQYLQQVLGARKQSFVSNMVSLVSNNKNLQQCEPLSTMYAGMKATALDLSIDPNLGLAYVIPYNGKDGNVAQFQIGYKGFYQLAMRSGQYLNIEVCEFYDSDSDIDIINRLFSIRKSVKDEQIVGYVAGFTLLNGFRKVITMSVDEMEQHAKKYSQTYKKFGTGLWKDEKELMSYKTVLKRLLSRYGILSVELQEAIKYDQAVINEEQEPIYVDNLDEVNDQENQKATEILKKAFEDNNVAKR